MTIGRTAHRCEEVVPEGKRLRMKDWLESRIGDLRYPGLVWLDEKKQLFRIPWKHAALHGWDQNSDGALFRDWADHTGASIRNAHPKQLKATFRCALHSLPDVHEERNQAKKRGDDACRVYRFESTSSTAPKRRHIRIRNHKERARSKNALQRARVPYIRHTITLQPTNPHFSTWSNCSQPGTFQPTCGDSITHGSTETDLSFRYFNQQKPWTTQSNPDISHGLLSPQVKVNSETVDSQYQNAESLRPMRHSMSVPGISPPYFPEARNADENHTASQTASTYTPDVFSSQTEANETTSFFHSPISYLTSTQCTATGTAPLLSSPNYNSTCIETVLQSCHSIDTVDEAVASASVGLGYQPGGGGLSARHTRAASPYFDEKLFWALDASSASGTTQVSGGMSCEIPYSQERACVSPNFTSLKGDQLYQTSLRGYSDQMCLMDPTLPSQMLIDEPSQSFSTAHSGHFEIRSPTFQNPAEASLTENVNTKWLPSSHNESLLPGASTLLSLTSTTEEASLNWNSRGEDSTVSILSNCYNLPQYAEAGNVFNNTSFDQGATHAVTTQSNSPVYVGYPSQYSS